MVAAATISVLWMSAFVLTFTTYTFFNDHFHRLSSARQIARYGELPFRDFFDPGFVLTEFVSAGVQLVFGDNLLGEMLFTSACIATGTVCIFLLVHRITQSMPAAIVTSIAAVMTAPRLYDYDKFLFYPLGLLACWRYAETRRRGEVAVLAAVVVVAGMFRYDNGVFIAVSAVTVMVASHVRDRSLLLRRAAVFIAACAVFAIPYLVFLQFAGGVTAAIAQMATYAVREGAHTRLVELPSMLEGASFSWSVAGASAAIYYLYIALPLAAVCCARMTRSRRGVRLQADLTRRSPPDVAQHAQVWSAAVMTLLVAVLILRQPIAARVGGAIAPAAVLAAWMWHRGARFRVARAVGAFVVVATLSVATEWRSTLIKFRYNVGRLGIVLSEATVSPPPMSMLGTRQLAGVIDYVRRCTRPADRIYVTWFAPEVYFLSGRAFAGGIAATFGDHWSEPEYQRRTVAKMTAEAVPIVLLREGDESFAQNFPIVNEYFRSRYQLAGASSFGETSGERYTVLTPIDRRAAGVDAATSMPCFAGSPGPA